MSTAAIRAPKSVATILTILVMLLGITATTGVAPAEASTSRGVNAIPSNETGHWWSDNGCSAVPDSGWWNGSRFDFHHACQHHDGGYKHHWGSRYQVDRWFYNDMIASCKDTNPWWRRGGCYQLAWAYYVGVRNYGVGAYYSRSPNVRMNAYV